MYRNPEHYPDPTAGAALCQLRRKENRLNTGKQCRYLLRRQRKLELLCGQHL